MKSKDPKTKLTFDLNLDPQLMEWIQEELENVPEAELDRLRVLRAAVKVHAEQMCPVGDTARDRAYLELVIAHFVGATICAWCGDIMSDLDGTGISHGCCAACEAKANAELDAMKAGL